METSSLHLINELTNNKRKAISKLLLIIFFEHIIPLLNYLFHKYGNRFLISNKLKSIIKNFEIFKICLDLIYKFIYLFKDKFIYANIIQHILGIMIVNKGSKEAFSDKFLNIGKQINLFIIFLFLRIGEWYYNKEIENNNSPVKLKSPEKIITTKYACPICLINSSEISSVYAARCCGYIFCELCIKNHLKLYNSCFFCKNASNESELIKIYNCITIFFV